MATTADIETLRGMINEPDNAGGFDNTRLNTLLDANDQDLNAVAAQVWMLKASSAASLVDVSESGSSRKLSTLYTQALEMQKFYANGGTAVEAAGRARSRTRAIARP